jgi:hypothetical protein
MRLQRTPRRPERKKDPAHRFAQRADAMLCKRARAEASVPVMLLLAETRSMASHGTVWHSCGGIAGGMCEKMLSSVSSMSSASCVRCNWCMVSATDQSFPRPMQVVCSLCTLRQEELGSCEAWHPAGWSDRGLAPCRGGGRPPNSTWGQARVEASVPWRRVR